MNTKDIEFIAEPIIQYGFAGFSLILLGILIWMITKFYNFLIEVTKILVDLNISMKEQGDLMVKVKDNLLSRPCIKEVK